MWQAPKIQWIDQKWDRRTSMFNDKAAEDLYNCESVNSMWHFKTMHNLDQYEQPQSL